jgi:hypothetical protein
VDAFAVEYYRTLASGLPREVYLTAMFTPQRIETAPKRTGMAPGGGGKQR